MNANTLLAFLTGDISGAALQADIGAEVDSWAQRLSERGRSAAVALIGMNRPVDITLERAARLLDSYITSELLPASFAYVLDALLLDDRFRWTSLSVREAMEYVLGQEYPRKLDRRRAWKVKAELKELAAKL